MFELQQSRGLLLRGVTLLALFSFSGSMCWLESGSWICFSLVCRIFKFPSALLTTLKLARPFCKHLEPFLHYLVCILDCGVVLGNLATCCFIVVALSSLPISRIEWLDVELSWSLHLCQWLCLVSIGADSLKLFLLHCVRTFFTLWGSGADAPYHGLEMMFHAAGKLDALKFQQGAQFVFGVYYFICTIFVHFGLCACLLFLGLHQR